MGRPAGPPTAAGTPAGTPAGSPAGDPVRALLAEYRALCERAVHPLEVAAALEDAGLTDHGAARYRHADVFALAEELYARVERRPADPVPPPPAEPWPGDAAQALGTALLHLAAAVLMAAVPWLLRTFGPAGAVPAVLFALGWLTAGAPVRGAVARTVHVLGAALLLASAAAAGVVPAVLLAGAAGTADFAVRRLCSAGRGHLASAKTADEFRSRMRPLLPAAAAAQFAAAALCAALLPPGGAGPPGPAGWSRPGALAVVVLLAAALSACGRPAAGAAVAGVTGAVLLVLPGADGLPGLGAAAVAVAAVLPAVRLLLGRPWTFHAPSGTRR